LHASKGLACYITTQCHKVVECFFLLLKSATANFFATTKLTETICFADCTIFNVHLIQIIFESKYLKNSDIWIQILMVRTLHPLCQSTHSNFSILTVLSLQRLVILVHMPFL